MTVRQAAARLGVCTATIYALVADGQLRVFRIRNAVRVAEDELVRYLAEQR